MTSPLRLLFDDCLSKHAIAALGTLASYSDGVVEVSHLVDFALSGQPDDKWIPQVGKDKILISTDRGKKNHGGKLPLICKRHGLTHVLMSAAVHQRNQFDKIRALFEVWPELLLAADGQVGCGYLLKVKNRGHGVELLKFYEPPSDLPPKMVQQELLP